MAGAAARWLLPLRAGRRCDLLCSNPAQRPSHKNHVTRTLQETSAHALHHILCSDTCTPHTRATARRNSSDALSTYGTYTHCAPRVPARTVGQPSAFKTCVPRTRAPSSSPVASLLVSSLSCSPLRRFGRTRVHRFFCAWTSGTCLASSCWRKGFGDGADFEGFLVSPFAYGFGADGFSVFLFFCFPLFVFLYSPRKGGAGNHNCHSRFLVRLLWDQTTSTDTVISSFVCTVQALDSRRTSSRNMCR